MQQGLLSQSGMAQNSAPPVSPMPDQPQPVQGASGASPEEQQMYDIVVGQTTESIYGPMLESVKQRLQAGAGDGVEDDIGAIVGNLLAMNYQGAAEAGKSIPPKVIAGAAKELTEVVTDISVEMGLLPQGEADNAADEALYAAMGVFGKALPNMPPEEAQMYAQMIQQLEMEEGQAKGMMQQTVQPVGAMP